MATDDETANLLNTTMPSGVAYALHEILKKRFGEDESREVLEKEYKSYIDWSNKTIGILEDNLRKRNAEIETLRELTKQAQAVARSVRLQYAGRYTSNKALRRENVELKRKLRQTTAFKDYLMKVLKRDNLVRQALSKVPNQPVEENKNQRDREILKGFFLMPMDAVDDMVVCGWCDGVPNVESVPKNSDLLAVYFVARGHWEKKHMDKGEN